MRVSYRLIVCCLGAALLLEGTADAQSWWGRRPQPRTRQSSTRRTPRRPAGQQPGFDDEKLVMSRVRGYQARLAREEQLLNRRLAEAQRIRQQGLQQKDQRLLDRAEQYERRALAAYQQRVQYFERQRIGTTVVPTDASGAPVRTRTQPTTRSRSTPSPRHYRSASPRRRTSRR